MFWVAITEITQQLTSFHIVRICHKLVLTLKETKYKNSKHKLYWKDAFIEKMKSQIKRLMTKFSQFWKVSLSGFKTNLFEV